MKKRWMPVLIFLIFWLGSIRIFAATTIPTDVSVASGNCSLLGLEGKYIVQAQSALARINKIRYEACQEGVLNPSTGRRLTETDYVPIRWSTDLEYIARIRAAEASVTMDHTRTNGASCFEIQSPNGITSSGEVLAWNWSESMLDGIEQWYSEKQDWVKQNANAVTGHYTQMIDPENLYVGLGTFCSEKTWYYNTTAGEFASYDRNLNESCSSGINECIQVLEVNNAFLNGRYAISGTATGKRGDVFPLKLTASVTVKDYWGNSVITDGLLVLSSITWHSSDPSVALAGSDGIVRANYCGTAIITAAVQNGKNATLTFTVQHTEVADPAVPATVKTTGLTKGSHCSVCGAVITKQKTVAKLKLKKGKVYTVENLKYKMVNTNINGKGTVVLTGSTVKGTKLKTLNVPDKVKIGGVSFLVTGIQDKAFKNYKKLVSVTIGKYVNTIGKEAFYGCSALSKATLGAGITKISDKAFMNCKKLKTLTIRSKKLKTVGTNAVKSIYKKATIRVPSSKRNAYKKVFRSKTGFKTPMKITK